MERFREIFVNVFILVLVILVAVFGYYLGGIVTLSGLIITVLVLVIINMAGYNMEHGQGTILLSMGFSGWFLIGFIPGLVISRWFS